MSLFKKRIERIEKILRPNKTRLPPEEELLTIIPDETDGLQVSAEKKERLIQERLEELNQGEYGPNISREDLVVFELRYVDAKGAENEPRA